MSDEKFSFDKRRAEAEWNWRATDYNQYDAAKRQAESSGGGSDTCLIATICMVAVALNMAAGLRRLNRYRHN